MRETKTGPNRRALLTGAALAMGAAGVQAQSLAQTAAPPASVGPEEPTDPDFYDPAAGEIPPPPAVTAEIFPPGAVDWSWVRSQWAMAPEEINLSAMLFASNPKPVRDAIDRHRRGLDASPVLYLERNNRPLQNAARQAAGHYFGTLADNVALCESTTSGIGLLYNGLDLRYGQEVLTTTHDYYITHESLRLATQKHGGSVRKVTLFSQSETVTKDEIVTRLISSIGPQTRVLALTWVHSSTGLKMPIRAIADVLAQVNATRPPSERILFSVDGAHGFGVENETLASLGCDFLTSGCHKWLFGPRGTGVVFGTPYGWSRVTPTVPSFLAPNAYSAWIGGYDPGPTTAVRMTPGGFKAFEHVWALIEAFAFHEQVGKAAIAQRTHELCGRLKVGLAQMSHVRLRTPMSPDLSAGIVSFDVNGLSPQGVVRRLRTGRVIGSVAPYAVPHVRLTPSFRNTQEEVDYALALVDAMKPRPRPVKK
jgi:isopenicillin-N epimerase